MIWSNVTKTRVFSNSSYCGLYTVRATSKHSKGNFLPNQFSTIGISRGFRRLLNCEIAVVFFHPVMLVFRGVSGRCLFFVAHSASTELSFSPKKPMANYQPFHCEGKLQIRSVNVMMLFFWRIFTSRFWNFTYFHHFDSSWICKGHLFTFWIGMKRSHGVWKALHLAVE